MCVTFVMSNRVGPTFETIKHANSPQSHIFAEDQYGHASFSPL